MRLSIIAVGTKMPGWVKEGVAEYEKRMPREWKLQWREVAAAKRGKDASATALKLAEGQRILQAIPSGDVAIALDVKGKNWSTEDLAGQLQNWQMSGDNYSLIIGGADGLSEEVLDAAKGRWSLGALTLPHPLVRVVLAEQLYRAWTITANHPYHRA